MTEKNVAKQQSEQLLKYLNVRHAAVRPMRLEGAAAHMPKSTNTLVWWSWSL
jgi:hypothetical protein